ILFEHPGRHLPDIVSSTQRYMASKSPTADFQPVKIIIQMITPQFFQNDAFLIFHYLRIERYAIKPVAHTQHHTIDNRLPATVNRNGKHINGTVISRESINVNAVFHSV